MSSNSRLDRVDRHLSAKQMVLLEIRESRSQHNTLLEHAHAVAIHGPKGGPLLDRIERSVILATAGVDDKRQIAMIRDAQREGLFLRRLALRCETSTLEQRREFELTTALAMAQFVILTGIPEFFTDLAMGWRDSAMAHHQRLLDHQAAIQLIAQEFFDGTNILFRDTEKSFQSNLCSIAELLKRFDELIEGLQRRLVKTNSPKHAPADDDSQSFLAGLRIAQVAEIAANRESAYRLAQGWASLVRSSIMLDFGEEREALAKLERIIAGDDQDTP